MSAPDDSCTDAAKDAVRDTLDNEHDFGGWLAHVLEDVARERGGSETLVAARPGSWEAEHVRHLAAGADFD
jgi:hypothetical protein